VQSVELNGKKYEKRTISHQEIINGGILKFQMGSQPKKQAAPDWNSLF